MLLTRFVRRRTLGNYLEYVDPTRYYENVYDYVHFLDPWAALGYNIGETCLFGNGDRNATESQACKYCSKFVGYPASVVVREMNAGPFARQFVGR